MVFSERALTVNYGDRLDSLSESDDGLDPRGYISCPLGAYIASSLYCGASRTLVVEFRKDVEEKICVAR